VESIYSQVYAELYRQHWWWRVRESLILERLRQLELPGSPPAILDVGCGEGLFFDRLTELGDVWGVEPAPVAPDEPSGGRIFTGAFGSAFEPGRRFSLILMLDVLEHIEDAEAALRHALRLLEPGGSIVITVPAFRALWTSHDTLNHHFTRYTSRSFRALADRAGMNIHSMRYFFHWLFPLKLMVRGFERLTGRPPRPPAMPPHWVNQVLMRFCMLEQAVTRRLRVPFGSSLLIIGTHASPERTMPAPFADADA